MLKLTYGTESGNLFCTNIRVWSPNPCTSRKLNDTNTKQAIAAVRRQTHTGITERGSHPDSVPKLLWPTVPGLHLGPFGPTSPIEWIIPRLPTSKFTCMTIVACQTIIYRIMVEIASLNNWRIKNIIIMFWWIVTVTFAINDNNYFVGINARIIHKTEY